MKIATCEAEHNTCDVHRVLEQSCGVQKIYRQAGMHREHEKLFAFVCAAIAPWETQNLQTYSTIRCVFVELSELLNQW